MDVDGMTFKQDAPRSRDWNPALHTFILAALRWLEILVVSLYAFRA